MSNQNQTGPLLSVCSIFRDEEQFLDEFLDVVLPYADELILVDTGSKDRSLDILKAREIPWHSFDWVHHFPKARNFSLSLAQASWIMVLDIDDRVSAQNFEILREKLPLIESDGIYLSYHHLKINDWLEPSPSIKDVQARLMIFRNHRGYYYRNPVHETIDTVIAELGGKMEHLNLPIFHLGYIEGMVRKKDERNRDLILQNYRDNPQVPLNIYNYTTVRWKEDPKILEKLENAFENANHALRYAVAERALAWLDEFKKDCLPDEENLWEERLSAQDPNAALLHLRRARSAFLKQDLNSSIESYRRVFSRIIFEDLHPEVAREVLDRLGVLEAMQGNFAKALEMVTELESRFGRNPGSFYLTLKLLFASSEFDLLLEQAQNLPEDLSSLPLPKLQEILSFLEKLPITQKKSVLMRFQEAAFSKK